MVVIMMSVPSYTVSETGQSHTGLWWEILKESLARPRHRGADNIKMALQEV
jgi:hypothetical protein